MTTWYTRPLVFVTDVARSTDFYVNRLGFTQAWAFQEQGTTFVAQVDREGCELILSSQWPAKVGTAILFISLDLDVLVAVRAELEGRGADVKDGKWGYDLMVVRDPDGNELYFPYPKESAPEAADGA